MINQNPFSLYDFLGYFIPGASFVYLFILIQGILNQNDFSTLQFLDNFEKSKFHGILLIIIISYVIGHLLSYTSSITVEKYGNWKYGYPSKYLIGLPIQGYWKKGEETKDEPVRQIVTNFWRLLIALLLLPLTLLDWLIGTLIGIKKSHENSLDPFLRKAIEFKVTSLYQHLKLNKTGLFEIFDPINQDFNRIVSHYAFENCKEHQFRMVNYVALYGFLRNLSLIFTLTFWYFFFEGIKTINFNADIDWTFVKILLLLMTSSFVAFMGFMKFYRRYTLEGLMLIVIDKNL